MTARILYSKETWGIGMLPPSLMQDELTALPEKTTDPALTYGSAAYTKMHAPTALALYLLNHKGKYINKNGDEIKVSVVQPNEGVYWIEYKEPWEPSIRTVLRLDSAGVLEGGLINESSLHNGVIDSATPPPKSIDPIDTDEGSMMVRTAIMLLLLLHAKDTVFANSPELLEILSREGGAVTEEDYFRISGSLEHFVCDDPNACKCKIFSGGIVEAVKREQVLVAVGGNVVLGTPKLLKSKMVKKKSKVNIAEAKASFASYTDTLSWTAEEEEMIPQFPDDYMVMPEVMTIAQQFINHRDSKRPMVNFLWRAETSYGKSTGFEQLACILHTPLVRMTCHSSMETADFISNYVPVTNKVHANANLPTMDDMIFDPDTAYQQITGETKENVSYAECLTAYAEVFAQQSSNGPRFKLVESPLVRAMKNGWICEVQEMSRIRDSGVMVGLNELDRADAMIPLADGTFVKRHPNAIVGYTDNVGYCSCRPVDPSVVRRMSFVINSPGLTKEQILHRVTYNTGFDDKDVLNLMYDVWDAVRKYCHENEVTDGAVSATELEMWASFAMSAGTEQSDLIESCRMCVVNKATNDWDTIEDIMSGTVQVVMGRVS